MRGRPGRLLEHRLAIACGYPHPDFVLPYMTLEQMSDVIAYDRIEPMGEIRADYRMAQVCLMLHNLIQMQRGDGKWTRATLQDFMLWGPKVSSTKPIDKPQSVEEMKAIMLTLARPKKEKDS